MKDSWSTNLSCEYPRPNLFVGGVSICLSNALLSLLILRNCRSLGRAERMTASSLISGMRLRARQVRAGTVTETALPNPAARSNGAWYCDQNVECWMEGVAAGPHAEQEAKQPILYSQSFTLDFNPCLERKKTSIQFNGWCNSPFDEQESRLQHETRDKTGARAF